MEAILSSIGKLFRYVGNSYIREDTATVLTAFLGIVFILMLFNWALDIMKCLLKMIFRILCVSALIFVAEWGTQEITGQGFLKNLFLHGACKLAPKTWCEPYEDSSGDVDEMGGQTNQ